MNISKKFVSAFLALFTIFTLAMPVMVSAAVDPAGFNSRTISFVDSGVTGDNLLVAMGAAAGTDYKKGNVSFKGGTLTVTTKGVVYDLLTVKDGTDIYVDINSFKKAKKSDVSAAMELFVKALNDVAMDPDTAHQIMNDIQDVDSSVSSIMLPLIFASTKGDMFAAYKIMAPFLDVLSIVLGVGAVILILILLFSTVMDLAYIGLPVWREAQEGKNNGKHPFGVSYEALRTVQEVEKGIGGGDGEYRNAYLLYFKRRALTYIILAICIMYLICGGLSGIIGFVLQLVSGITG